MGYRGELEKPRWGERKGDPDWEKWRVTEKDTMETEIQRGQGGDWIVKGRQRDRQRDTIEQ